MGLAAGMPAGKVLKSIQAGFGDALGFIAVVVGLGAMIGAYLEYSGGGRVLADWLLERFGKERAAWAMLVAVFPGRPAHLFRGWLHHHGAAGVEPDARDQALAAVLRHAHGRRP